VDAGSAAGAAGYDEDGGRDKRQRPGIGDGTRSARSAWCRHGEPPLILHEARPLWRLRVSRAAVLRDKNVQITLAGRRAD
jgi:hypothetical protein